MTDQAQRDSSDVGLAHLVLAMLWGAHALAPAVFEDPLFTLPHDETPCDADAAAAWLASLPKPTWVTATSRGGNMIALSSAPPPPLPQREPDPARLAYRIDFLTAMAAIGVSGDALILAGSRPFHVKRASLERLGMEYWLTPSIAMTGGPTEENSQFRSLGLPSEWLSGVDFVMATGQHRTNGTSFSFSGPDGWRAFTVRSV